MDLLVYYTALRLRKSRTVDSMKRMINAIYNAGWEWSPVAGASGALVTVSVAASEVTLLS
jgi:hypothetical protein